MEYVKNILGDEFVIPFSATTEKTNSSLGYKPFSTNFDDIIKKISPDIIHFARSGYYEWPFDKRVCPIQIETNIIKSKYTKLTIKVRIIWYLIFKIQTKNKA